MMMNRYDQIRLTETESISLRQYLKRLGDQKLGYSAAKLLLLDRRKLPCLDRLSKSQAARAEAVLDGLKYQDTYIETLSMYAQNRSRWTH